MRITAQKVLQEQRHRRVVFNEGATQKADRFTRQSYLEGAALEFVCDILDESDMPSVPTVAVGALRGFETNDDFYKGTGFLELYASFTTAARVTVRVDFLMPVVRGSLYRPSIIRINNRRIVFGPFVINAVIESTKTERLEQKGLYANFPDKVHLENIEHGIYEVPYGEFSEPIRERYLVDSYRW